VRRTDLTVSSEQGSAIEDGAKTEAIREDIERTRLEMTGTIDAIQERLSPAAIKGQVLEKVREHLQEAKDTVREATIGKVEDFMETAADSMRTAQRGVVATIRENPVPAVLVGVGIGWLIASGFQGSSMGRRGVGRYRSARPKSYGSNAVPYANQRIEPGMLECGQRFVDDAVEGTRSVASDMADDVQETASKLSGAAQERVERIGGWLQDTMDENPLAVGAAVLAAGAVVGMSIPLTRKENELMGETRDQLASEAQQVASEAMQQVRRVADRVTDRFEGTNRPEPGR